MLWKFEVFHYSEQMVLAIEFNIMRELSHHCRVHSLAIAAVLC